MRSEVPVVRQLFDVGVDLGAMRDDAMDQLLAKGVVVARLLQARQRTTGGRAPDWTAG
jgi:hypothetical protein